MFLWWCDEWKPITAAGGMTGWDFPLPGGCAAEGGRNDSPAASFVQLSGAAAPWVSFKSSCYFGLLLPHNSGDKNSSGRKLWLTRDGGSLCCGQSTRISRLMPKEKWMCGKWLLNSGIQEVGSQPELRRPVWQQTLHYGFVSYTANLLVLNPN